MDDYNFLKQQKDRIEANNDFKTFLRMLTDKYLFKAYIYYTSYYITLDITEHFKEFDLPITLSELYKSNTPRIGIEEKVKNYNRILEIVKKERGLKC